MSLNLESTPTVLLVFNCPSASIKRLFDWEVCIDLNNAKSIRKSKQFLECFDLSKVENNPKDKKFYYNPSQLAKLSEIRELNLPSKKKGEDFFRNKSKGTKIDIPKSDYKISLVGVTITSWCIVPFRKTKDAVFPEKLLVRAQINSQGGGFHLNLPNYYEVIAHKNTLDGAREEFCFALKRNSPQPGDDFFKELLFEYPQSKLSIGSTIEIS